MNKHLNTNDVIELAKQLKKLAIDVKFDRYDFVWLQTQIKDDWGQDTTPAKYLSALSNYYQIIRLCEAIEKLAAYESIGPIAWTSEEEIIKMRETGTHLEGYPIPFEASHTVELYRLDDVKGGFHG
ncbi:hypothetical protein PSI22_04250 [Xenorhabdus sp. XENO-7]|uniref:Uncharacterized protein n=1 Tax=Xenorhabdus aichiensis TaxID=3025874 RepID=A0ABT5M067_9GAMM|nr:hypothetical protein [Xenorhabdus aichiensis]MDC9620856.1 hypothetical protein [Xenorhabdus aichiensis]